MGKKIKKLLPWWAKIAGKIVLSRAPVAYAFWQSLGFFRHGDMDASAYALDVFNTHLLNANLHHGDLAGKVILEIGPGDSIATAMIAYAYGASTILVDSAQWARNDISPYKELARVLREKGLRAPDMESIESIESILQLCGGRYITDGLSGWRQVEDETVDFVFSQAVLEHVRKHEFRATLQECWRVMKRQAIASHRVDLRDHLAEALNNLRFEERVWESDFFVSSGFYTNRIQMDRMVDLFKQAGFSVEILRDTRWECLPTPKEKMAPDFAKMSDDKLCVSGFDLLCRKINLS